MTARLLGLRVDVDTHDGMRLGVPRLLDIMKEEGVKATFYLSMGPDRSGLAVLNALRPGFLRKMTRTDAAQVYGLRTVLSGTLLPSRPIATAFPEIARRVRDEGHETGVHAWDHRKWQDRLLGFPPEQTAGELDKGFQAYQSIFGEAPRTYAAPAWLTSDDALLHEEAYGLAYATDCRGTEPFLPIVRGRTLATPQVPATLPTLDEALGDTFSDAPSYFAAMVEEAIRSPWPVFTLHSELEGGPYAEDFRTFLRMARAAGLRCVPLGELLAERQRQGSLPACPMHYAPVRGRHGVLSTQRSI
ncbi:MAG: undecaprenyl phosphate-alpha-L-ara4FN deformylase [Acidobacteriota bacterium]|jgi:peptidoglycan/xylan/chitin deacetylase (PgdA/CDA1 family)|nr:undecaprenyl phosphate-alpha-L-ara4FN deformylase [Acidobacteriota bacterium]